MIDLSQVGEVSPLSTVICFTPSGTGVNALGQSDVSVEKDINSQTTGIYAVESSIVNVGGSVSGSTGGNNYNVVSVGDETAAQDGSKVTVGGDVTSDQGRAVVVNSGSTISVEGSITSKGDAAVTMSNDSEVEVKKDVTGESGLVIKETSSQGGGMATVLGTVTADSSGYCITVTGNALTKEDVVNALPTIIVGELSSANQQYVEYQDKSGQGTLDTNAVAQAIADQILYYIDVQETKNGKMDVSGTKKEGSYNVAKANDVITVTVTADNGYEIKSVDGGKATAKKNDDGTWSITVPKTGGVSISAIMQAIRQVNGDNGSGGDDSNTNTTGTPAQQTYTEEQAADHSRIHVYGKTTGPDNTRSGAVLSDSDEKAGVIDVFTGDAKTNGLNDDVKNTITALDGGNLGAVTAQGVDFTAVQGVNLNSLGGMKTSGATVALGIRPDKVKDVSVKLYAPDLPAGAVPYVLFYNNITGKWSLLPAAIDPVTGLVDFVLPDDGTVVIVY